MIRDGLKAYDPVTDEFYELDDHPEVKKLLDEAFSSAFEFATSEDDSQ